MIDLMMGLYDDELECLYIAYLSHSDVEKWISLSSNYNQDFIETGGYMLYIN